MNWLSQSLVKKAFIEILGFTIKYLRPEKQTIPFDLTHSFFAIFHVVSGNEIFVIFAFKDAVWQTTKKFL